MRLISSFKFGIASIVTVLLGACASAPSRTVTATAPRAIDVAPDRIALAPLEYVRFCMSYAQQCRAGEPNAVIALTPDMRAAIERVNREVNSKIRPTQDTAPWRINPAYGNCNDYVVSKRHELMAMGLPASALLIATARTAAGEGHLLLIVQTDQGNLVLDNLASEIRPTRDTSYAWIKRQSASDPRVWEKM